MTRLRTARLSLLAVLAVSPAPADGESAPDWLGALRIRGRLKEELAYRLHDPGDVSKIRTVGWLEGKYTFSEAVTLRIEGRGFWDGVFKVTSRYPPEVERDQGRDLSLRQALLSLSLGRFDLRLGRQQIVWAEALGTFVADVVNPRDLREFVLPDFTELRIPLWAVDFSAYLADGLSLEAVWTPDARSHQIGKEGSEFQFQGPRYQFTVPVRRLPDDQDGLSLARSEAGLRLSYLLSGWDLSLFYYDGNDKFAVLHQRREATPTGSEIVLEPRHDRIRIVGATLAKSIEPVVLRAEAAFTVGKRYETTDPLDPEGVVRRDTLDYLIGVDRTFAGKVDTALQFSQKILAGPATGLARGAIEARVTSSVAVRVATGFLDDRLNPVALFVVNVSRRDYRFSPKVEVLPAGSMKLALGADFFGGPSDTLYGEFEANDRVYFEAGWQF